jgi:flagellar basal body-associated protein FliL
MEAERQKKKSIKLIIIGIAVPVTCLVITILGFFLLNFVLYSTGNEGASGLALVLNTILTIVAVIGVSGLIWGPILVIVGIMKMPKLGKKGGEPTQPAPTPTDQQPVVNKDDEV